MKLVNRQSPGNVPSRLYHRASAARLLHLKTGQAGRSFTTTRLIPALALCTLTVWVITGTRGICEDKRVSPAELSWQTFDQLHRFIKPQPGECRFWEVEWELDVAAARARAAKEGKPLLVLSGHRGSPLGNCRWSVAAARDPEVWNETFTRLIRERCVAVTIPDAGTARKRTDSTGAFLIKANVGQTALTSNFCMDVVTATGEHLGRIQFNTPGVALKSLQNALDKFAALPEDRRRGNVPEEQSAIPGPPPGTLILRIYLRQLGRNPDGTLRYTEPGDYTDKTPMRNRPLCRQPFDDYMWVTEKEWKALIPAEPAPGMKVVIPESLQLRLLRYHLNPRVGFTEGPCFARATLKDGSLHGKVEQVTNEELHLRIEGSAKLRLGDDLSFTPTILGKLVFDRARKQFRQFDLVALGDVTGHIQHGGGGFRPGAQPLGIAFELITKPRPTDFLPPGGPGDPGYLDPK
jgi:hypothetical protein